MDADVRPGRGIVGSRLRRGTGGPGERLRAGGRVGPRVRLYRQGHGVGLVRRAAGLRRGDVRPRGPRLVAAGADCGASPVTVRGLRRAGIATLCGAAAWWLSPRVIRHQPLRARFPTSTAVYDGSSGLLRLTLSTDEKYRVWVPLDRMSPLLVDATLLQEDRLFRLHPGVNPLALVRGALRTYVARAGGGSATDTTRHHSPPL